MTKSGLDGDGAAASSAMTAIEDARSRHGAKPFAKIDAVVRVMVRPGSVNSALEPLRMATKLDRYRETARIMLEPWIVQAALARLRAAALARGAGDCGSSVRTPHKVRWPNWWVITP